MSPVSSPGLSNGSPLYTWKIPGCPICVQIHLDVIEGIRRQLDSASSRGDTVATCGLLTGELPAFGVTAISGFHPLQTLDSAETERSLKSVRRLGVGFYRTARDGSPSLSDDEISLAKSCFRHPGFVVLSIESGPTITGRFFFWERGALVTDTSRCPSFPFSAPQLNTTEWNPSASPERAAPFPPRNVWLGRARWLGGTALVITAALVYGFSEHESANSGSGAAVTRPARASSATKSVLSLIAERQGADLLVSWNPESPAISGASLGTLSIHDGNIVTRNMLLAPDQLSSGHLLYAPVSDDVEIRLSVSDANQSTTSDSITVLLPQGGSGRSLMAAATSPDLPSKPLSLPKLPALPAPAAVDVDKLNRRPAANLLDVSIASLTTLSNQPHVDVANTGFSPPDKGPVLIQNKLTSSAVFVTRNPITYKATVQVQISVDSAGTVVKAVLPRPNAAEPFGPVAINMAQKLKFQPAMIHNAPVPSEMFVNFHFSPRK